MSQSVGPANNPLVESVSNASIQFGLSFMRNSSFHNGCQNVVLSPLSIQIVLNLILLGAKEKSATEDELLRVLGYSELARSGRLEAHTGFKQLVERITEPLAAGEKKGGALDLHLASLILTNSDLAKPKAEFAAEAQKLYNNLRLEEFADSSPRKELSERLNAWVANMTKGQIAQIVNEADLPQNDLVMVLLSAAHIKGEWLYKFAENQTVLQLFFNRGQKESAKQTKFMRRTDKYGYADFTAPPERVERDLDDSEKQHLAVAEKLDCRAISIPFSPDKGNELDMIVLLPNKRDGLPRLVANLTGASLRLIYNELESRMRIKVELPKFSFESEHDVKQVLNAMGLNRVFSTSAELDRMLTGKNNVDKVMHKAKIKVDENGAEAAAATVATVVMRSSTWPPTPPFKVDHPFVFLIRHKPTGALLFLGSVSSL